jgi:hypothetical protein
MSRVHRIALSYVSSCWGTPTLTWPSCSNFTKMVPAWKCSPHLRFLWLWAHAKLLHTLIPAHPQLKWLSSRQVDIQSLHMEIKLKTTRLVVIHIWGCRRCNDVYDGLPGCDALSTCKQIQTCSVFSVEREPKVYTESQPRKAKIDKSRLGGLVVIVLATVPKVRGFKPGRGRWI